MRDDFQPLTIGVEWVLGVWTALHVSAASGRIRFPSLLPGSEDPIDLGAHVRARLRPHLAMVIPGPPAAAEFTILRKPCIVLGVVVAHVCLHGKMFELRGSTGPGREATDVPQPTGVVDEFSRLAPLGSPPPPCGQRVARDSTGVEVRGVWGLSDNLGR